MLGHFQVVPQRGKPKRQPHFKSKSGCPTCKIRHLKCDEAKPICRRCATAGLACDGYLYDSKTYTDDASRPLAKVLLPRLQNLTSSIERSLDLITASSQDKRCFHFFRTASVPQLTGHFDAEFWTSQLLKICHSEPGVWHSVLALGALHEDFICSHKKSKDGSLSVTRRFALGHYNQAIRVLTQTKRLDVILVSCFMFVIMELLLGNIEGAINQLHSGTRIFSARRAEIARKGLKPDTKDRFIEEYLLGPFHHLNLYSYIWGRPPARTVISPDPSVEDCPRTYDFQSLIQARASLLDVIISGGGTSGLQEWEEAFNEFLAQQGTAISSPRQIRSIAIIKLQHKWASICVPNLEETKFDAFVREFELGLNIADSQLRDDSGGLVPNDLHPVFSMTLQNFSTVYLTAIKCRNPALRRRALNLLKSSPNHPDHENFWNASTAIRLIERVIEIEEEGLEDLRDLTGSVVPSEWSRIQYIEKILEVGQENSTGLFRFRRKVDGEWQHFLERF